MFAEDNLSLVKFVCFTIKLSSLNHNVYNILEWTSWELSEALSIWYNLLIGVDYYNDRIVGGDFMDIMKDEFGDALDTYRETFGVDFPTMDFMGLSTEELTDKVWECIDNGSPIETNFDDEIKY